MMETKTSVDELWDEISAIQEILENSQEISSLSDYNKTIRKVLLLSCASFFEREMTLSPHLQDRAERPSR